MHIRSVTAKDLPDIASIQAEAFINDDYSSFLAPYRHQHPHDFRHGFLLRCKKRVYGGRLMVVAVSDEQDSDWDGISKVIGHAALDRCQDEQPSSTCLESVSWNALELQLLNLEERLSLYFGLDRSASRSRVMAFRSSSSDQDLLTDFTNCWMVEMLVVSPSHQRRGIGSALTRWCQDIARKDNLPLVLLASNAGAAMYKHVGFTSLGVVHQLELTSEAMVWNSVNKNSSLE